MNVSIEKPLFGKLRHPQLAHSAPVQSLFISTDEPFAIGNIVTVCLMCCDRDEHTKTCKVKAIGRVAWLAKHNKHPEFFPGVGIEIISITKKEKENLHQMLKLV